MAAVLTDVGLSPGQLGDVCVGESTPNTQPDLRGRCCRLDLTCEAFVCFQETFCSLEPERLWSESLASSGSQDKRGGACKGGGACEFWRPSSAFSGFPETVPVYTVNRQCSSGLQALLNIAGNSSSSAPGVPTSRTGLMLPPVGGAHAQDDPSWLIRDVWRRTGATVDKKRNILEYIYTQRDFEINLKCFPKCFLKSKKIVRKNKILLLFKT